MRTFLYLLLGSYFALSFVTSASSQPASTPQEPPALNFQVYCWPLPDETPADVAFSGEWFYESDEGEKSFSIYSGSKTGNMRAPARGKLAFYQKTVGEDGKPRKVLRAETVTPSSTTQALIVVFPNGTKADEGFHSSRLIDISPDQLPAGSVQIINFTDRAVAGMIKDERIALDRFASRSFIIDPEDPIFIARFAANVDGEPKYVYGTRRAMRPDQRYVMLLLNEKRGDRLTWKSMSFGGLANTVEASTGDE